MKFLAVAVILVVIGPASATMVNYTDCGSKGIVRGLDISPCSMQPCVLKYNSNVKIAITFSSKMPSNMLTLVGVAMIEGVPTPLPLPDPDACDLGVKCPIKPGVTNSLQQTIYIEYDFPEIKMDVKFELKDDKGDDVVCMQFPVQISS